MNETTLLEKCGFDEEAKLTVAKQSFLSGEYAKLKADYYNDEEKFLCRNSKRFGNDFPCVMLYLYLRFAADLYEVYKEKGFSDEEYFDTFSDLAVWNKMCRLETGIDGIREHCWITSHVHAGIVRLGRLQFQWDESPCEIALPCGNISVGERIYNVHIPEGGQLLPAEIDRSFDRARSFFGKNAALHIESWLLDPTLGEYLAPRSNILAFQRRFVIYKTEESNALERYVFSVVKANKNEYEPTTEFAKKVKSALVIGKSFFVGYGACRL